MRLGWNFGTNNTTILAKHAHIKVERHIKVKGIASPDDGNWAYWSQRKGASPGISQTAGMTLRKQKAKCAECGLHFHSDDRVEIHHLDGNYRNRRKENLSAVHGHCHDRTHQGQANLSPLISTYAKGQLGEEPDKRKLSRPVLKPSRKGDLPA